MDQNSTNGSGPDKRNWRERLGIGAKEMPKLSDEFREGSEAGEQARPAGAQPVTKPAPMAPRAPRAASSAEGQSSAPPPAAPPRATPRAPDNATQDALADKLRAQRAAAERLAEQRVQAARERAEGRTTPEAPPAPPPRGPASAAGRGAPPPPPPRSARPGVPPPPASARPKFSFAEDPPPARPAAEAPRPGFSGGPLNPPRAPLGGERGQPPFLRPSAPGAATRPPPSPYRPVDPGQAYAPPPRLQPPPGRPGYGGDQGTSNYPVPRGPQRRPPALEAYPRAPEREREYAPEPDVPRLGRPAPRGRGPDDYDEVFEDDIGSRPRASARDYQSAYGEREDAFADDQRRSGGPWLLLLALLAAALVTGGVVWYYNNGLGNVAGTGSSSGEVPVVNAPSDPAKVVPETPSAGGEEPAARRKQIYDRIVGDQEVIGGQLQPTEETPVQPTNAQPMNEVPAAADTNPIPAPDAQDQGTGADGLPSVDEPPPLPLPPAGQEGNLGAKSNQQIAATSAQPAQEAAGPPPLPEPEVSSSTTTSSAAAPPPPPETATDGAASVLGAPAPAETASIEQPEPAAPPPPKKKPAAKKKPVEENLGSEPVVLVPPAEPIGESAGSTAPEVAEAPAATAPAEKKPRSIMDLFRGGSDDAAAPAQQQTRVAAVEPPPAQPAPAPRKPAEPAPQPQQQAATGSGFTVQLSSFRSEADARNEYARLASAYPSVVGGLPQQIRQTSVGGSTRYQLGLGPLPSRSAATQVCSALITQGESDCIVRGR